MAKYGLVKSVTGVVTATTENGSQLILKIGDKVSASDIVATSAAGSVSIEYSDGTMMELGRNQSGSYPNELEISPENADALSIAEAEADSIRQLLLDNDGTFDPTIDQPAPAAGPGAGGTGGGSGEDDGFSIVQTEYIDSRMTPESGFETIGIDSPTPQPQQVELILNPIVTGTIDGNPTTELTPPSVEVFKSPEAGPDLPATLEEGERAKLGYRVDPNEEGDIITKVVISGFSELDNDTSSPDWQIQARAIDNSPNADYEVNFVDYSLAPDGQSWQVTLEVLNAEPGETVEFLLNTKAPAEIAEDNLPLQLEATYTNNAILFEQNYDLRVALNQVEEEQTPPAVNIFKSQESGSDAEAIITSGERAKLGYSTDPFEGDTVTKIVLRGFPEQDGDNSSPDWQIQSRAIDNSPNADYEVNFLDYELADGGDSWQVILDVLGAEPGEEINFLLNTKAPDEISEADIPLQFETTYTNDSGTFSPNSEVTIVTEPSVELQEPITNSFTSSGAGTSSTDSGFHFSTGSSSSSFSINIEAISPIENIDTNTL